MVRMLEPVLLLALHHGPAHGYRLLEQLADFDLDDVDPSIVYRRLREMEAQGWVVSDWDDAQTQGPPRRVYRLTGLGNEYLAGYTGELEVAHRVMARFLEAYQQRMHSGAGEQHEKIGT